jgi:sugar fermentation stimulation protein A
VKLPPLIKGTLVRRYKRFLADVELESGEVVVAHTGNPGRMIGLTEAGNTVYLTYHDSPKRKLKHSWDLVKVGRTVVGINTQWPNRIVAEAIEAQRIPELTGYGGLEREVKVGNSRIDLRLIDDAKPPAWVEVKNVTLIDERVARFPDAVSERGRKHLYELRDRVRAGERGVLVFLVQRADADAVGPADHIDPAYGAALREVVADGVEAIACQAQVSVAKRSIQVVRTLPVVL